MILASLVCDVDMACQRKNLTHEDAFVQQLLSEQQTS
jgi:hypothetical protein